MGRTNYPVEGYFNMRGLLTGESDGLIYEIDNNHNGIKEVELRNSLLNDGFLDIYAYVAISYTDIFNNKHSEFFQIIPSINQISKEIWSSTKASQISSSQKFYFPKLSSLEILKMYHESIK